MTVDEARDQIAKALYNEWRERNPGALTWETDAQWRRDPHYRAADRLMPILDAAVAEARAETAEAIAQAVLAASRSHARPASYQDLVDLARQHADGGSDSKHDWEPGAWR